MKIRDQEALDYHLGNRPGKIEVVPSKPCLTQRDLSLAYTPGVAVPCLRIHDDPDDAYQYTAKGNLVAVISNGTAVLGLGDIGALAGKPVMEGKGVLFKRFADIDVFDIEIDSHDPEEIINVVRRIAPTFGGINLEDIKAPECFDIEQTLKRELDIPVFHDDQHGTAIISGAALLNALEVAEKRIEEVRVVFNGAGASAMACAKFYIRLGVTPENLVMCDSRGVLYKGRTAGMNRFKEEIVRETDARTLSEAMVGADVFVGLSVGNVVTPKMLEGMAARPIIFAMANPTPEIAYDVAKAARPDALMATGRSDFPNQVNNVLGFPFIFRGALDVRATGINEEMKLAAAHSLAALTKEDVPDAVMKAYGLKRLSFGPEYLIPKPFDPRVLIWEASAVAEAAMASGVARRTIDLDAYREQLERRLGKGREVMRMVINQAKRSPRRVVFPEGTNEKVLRAAHIIVDEGFAKPILLGAEDAVRRAIEEYDVHLEGVEIVDPAKSAARSTYADALYALRRRKGVLRQDAEQMVLDPLVFGSMMVRRGDADTLVAGISRHYPETLRPVLQVLERRPGVKRATSVFMMVHKDRLLFFADPTIQIDPDAEALAEIAVLSAEVARRFHVEPRVAMVSFSNFGSVAHPDAAKVRRAVALVRERAPELVVDGEMQADLAVMPETLAEEYPFSPLAAKGANVLVFPDMQSANVAFKLVYRLGGAEAIGPILVGLSHPVHLLQYGCEAKDVVNMAAIAAVDAQELSAAK